MKVLLKKSFKILGLVSSLILFALAVYIGANWSDLKAFRGVLSGYHSHLYCSCFYVSKQSDSVCRDWARQYIPLQYFSHDPEKRELTSRAFGVSSKARFVNEKEGCILDRQ